MKPIDISTVKMGSDAEVFLRLKTGEPFPACGIIGGTKKQPLKLHRSGIAVQEDNVLLEFNTAVGVNENDWCQKLQHAQTLAYAKVPPTMDVAIEPVMRFNPAFLQNPQAQTFGCEPDIDAWAQQTNPRPSADDDPTLRSAAAHVHLSWSEPDIEQRFRVIQMADVFVSLPSLAESPDKERRKLYGKAGACRLKDYGVEHRVLDNYWLKDSIMIRKIWRRYMEAIKAANTSFVFTSEHVQQIQAAINQYQVKEGLALYNTLKGLIFPDMKQKLYTDKKPMQWITIDDYDFGSTR